MENNPLKYSDYYIAFLDLLGSGTIIKNDKDNKSLNDIHDIYSSWLNVCKNVHDFSSFDIKIFSDNILISMQANLDEALENLLEYVAYFAEHFLYCGYKLRGGITKGNLFIDKVFVWGDGLIDAYHLESQMAKYPRIIIKSDIIGEISENTRNLMIAKEKDIFYLDYLKAYGKTAKGYMCTIEKVLFNIEEELKNTDDEGIKEKLEWLKNYLISNQQYHNEKRKAMLKSKNTEDTLKS